MNAELRRAQNKLNRLRRTDSGATDQEIWAAEAELNFQRMAQAVREKYLTPAHRKELRDMLR